MTPADFEFISTLLHKRSGLVLTPDKTYLLESRLTPVARRLGLTSLETLIDSLRKSPREDALVMVTEAMTTNESFFFRDKTPFEQLQRLMIPSLTAARAKGQALKVWSAACSTGQEPYSLVMALADNPALTVGRSVEILATDLSMEVLARAREGAYSQFEVQRGLPVQMLVKYFDKVRDLWQIKEQFRAQIAFRQFNLLNAYEGLGPFDMIFCRNVLIYFDRQTKADILQRLAARLAPDGFLVMGSSETVYGITDALKPVDGERGLYQRADAQPQAGLAASA